MADWIWVPLCENYIAEFVNTYNNHQVRRQPNKQGPSHASHLYTYSFPEQFGGEDQLVRGDMNLIDQIMENHQGKAAMEFFPAWFDVVASHVFVLVGQPERSFKTAWDVFDIMLEPLQYQLSNITPSQAELLELPNMRE